jgi:hypothetical protein
VALAYIEPRFKLYLRFGEPARTHQLDRWRRCAVFLPGAMFCRIRWQANDYGTIRWQLMVMQACTPLDAAQRIPGVQPGARLLLHAEGENQVRAVLERIDAIEALGIAPVASRPRTGARSPTGSLRACRCPNTPPSGTPPGWPGGRCHDAPSATGTASAHPRSRLRARLVLAGLSACGLAALAWASFVHPLPRLTYNPSDSVAVGWYRVDPLDHAPPRCHVRCPWAASCWCRCRRRRRAGCAARLPADARSAAQARGRGRAATGVHRRRVVRIDGVPSAAVLPADRWAGRCHPGSSAAASNRANCSC